MLLLNWLSTLRNRISNSRNQTRRPKRGKTYAQRDARVISNEQVEALEDRALLATIVMEDFESDGSPSRYTTDAAAEGGGNGTDTATWGRSTALNTFGPAMSGFNGSNFWGADFLIVAPASQNPATFQLNQINISGHENLQFSGLFGIEGNNNSRYDAVDSLVVEYDLNSSGSYTKLFAIEQIENGTNNEPVGIDTDLDGDGDGAPLTAGVFFSSGNLSIPNGNTLDIRIVVSSNGTDEEFAFDDLLLTGDPIVTNNPPTAATPVVADIGEPEIGTATHDIAITYSDNASIDVSTFGTGDIRVNRPGGGTLNVSGFSVDNNTDGSPRTVTYTVDAPGGTWESTDDGNYTIDLLANEVADTEGAFAVASNGIGDFDVAATNTAPTVASVAALDVISQNLGDTSYSFTVTYTDVGGIDASSIGNSDVTITPPGGVPAVTGLTGMTTDPDGTSVTATYSFTPPGGAWDATDDGQYTINVVANEVDDVAGASVAAGQIGTFNVYSNKLLNETFETDGLGTRYTSSPAAFDGAAGIFQRSDGDDTPLFGTPLAGQQGAFYWIGDFLIEEGNGDTYTLTFPEIDISGFTNLALSGLFAAEGNNQTRFDPDDFLEVRYELNNSGTPVNALAFHSTSGSVNNEGISQDTDFDGIGDGTALTNTFASFSNSNIPDGNTLDITVVMRINGTDEELAFDNLMITGDAIVTNTAPSVTNSSAADVGEPEIGVNSYSFTVEYSDNSAVDVSTIDTSDVTVTGPGGIGNVPITGVTFSPLGNGSPRTATYTFTPPGGSWDAADNGTYVIDQVAGEVGDDGGPQLFAPAAVITTFNVTATNTDPVVAAVIAPDVIAQDLGGTSYSFTVTYTDVGGIDASSIGNADVTVTPPGGVSAVTSLTGMTTDPNGTSVTATYSFTPPDGSWDATDDGEYLIDVVASEVDDVVGASVAAGQIGTFNVFSNKLLNETFETDGLGTRYTSAQAFDGPAGHFQRSDGSQHAQHAPFTGQQGNFFWVADFLIEGGNPDTATLTFPPIDISAYTNLNFSGLFAAGGDNFEPSDFMDVDISIDGAPATTALAFESTSASVNNQSIAVDTDNDQVGDGTVLTSTFAPFTFNIPDGSTLDLTITVRLDGTNEEPAFDNLMITGDISDAIAPTLLSFTRNNPATSPTNADTLVFRATFDEDVINVNETDFSVVGTSGTITNISAVDAATYDITVSGGDLANLNGTVELNLDNGQDITDLAGNPLPNGDPATDETYDVVNLPAPVGVFLNEILIDPDGAADAPDEYIELRGPANQSLDNVFLVFVEGDSGLSQGEINNSHLINLTGTSIGSNGFLAIVDGTGGIAHSYSIAAGTTIIDVDGLDFENASYTAFLIHENGLGTDPMIGQDLDAGDDGLDALPTGWTILDGVSVLDGGSADRAYADIVFSADADGLTEGGAGFVNTGFGVDNVTHVMRIGDSVGSTAADWVAFEHNGAAPNFAIAGTTDGAYALGTAITDHLGATNPTTTAPLAVNLSVSGNGTEAAGTVVTVTATAAGIVPVDQTVDLAVTGTGITTADYLLSDTTITIPAGSSSGQVTFTVQDDSVVEALTESATLTISNPSDGISIGGTDSQNVTITDNDSATLSIDDVSELEGNSGNVAFAFTVTLDAAVDTSVDVELLVDQNFFGTANAADFGSSLVIETPNDTASMNAAAIADLAAGTLTLTFALSFTGAAGQMQTITITGDTGDTDVEPDETFLMNLQNISAGGRNVTFAVGGDQGQGTIVNDDNSVPTISVGNLSYTEDQNSGNPVQIDGTGATLNDADGDADWNGGTLDVQITANAEAGDEISIPDNAVGTINTDGTDLRDGTTVIGTLSAAEGTVTNGDTLTITFNNNATNALVQQVLRAISYRTTSNTPGTSDRTVTFTATDNGVGAPASASDTATISVTANNDPATLSFANVISLPEDQDTSSDIKVADVVISDPDGGTNDLALSGADAAFFNLVGTELHLLANAQLDFETKPTYSFLVEVDDATISGSPDNTAPFTLNITDVNEAPVVQARNRLTHILESTILNDSVRIATINVVDDALGSAILSLSGPDAAFFEFQGAEVHLKAGTQLDFETKPFYDVTVEADDATIPGSPDSTVSLRLQLLDVFEPPEADVTSGGQDIPDRGVINFGDSQVAAPAPQRTLTITNNGQSDLTIQPAVIPAGYTLVGPNFSTNQIIVAGGQASLTVEMSTATGGDIRGLLRIPNNDPNEPNYRITLSGAVIQPTTTPTIQPGGGLGVDDGDAGFLATGNWANVSNFGFENDALAVVNNGGSNRAIWAYGNLTPGLFDVSLTWLNGSDRDENVPVVIRDGIGGPVLSSLTVNQRRAPAGARVGNRPFELLDQVNLTGATLVVELSNVGASRAVIADAVLVTPFTPPPATPEITVRDNNGSVADGSAFNFATSVVGGAGSQTFTVRNDGTADLIVQPVSVSGAAFSVSSNFAPNTVIPAGGQGTFDVNVNTSTAGIFNGTLSFNNNDGDEDPFNLQLAATVRDPAAAVTIIDDGDPDFVLTANWVNVPNFGFSSDAKVITPNISGTATWTFNNLTAGDYNVSTTWLNGGDRASSVNYVLRDGVSGPILATVPVDQRVAPSGAREGGRAFSDLATVTLTGTTLVVEVDNAGTNGAVIADAVRIEATVPAPSTPEINVTQGALTVVDNGSFNLGSADQGDPTLTKTFTVENTGTANLTLEPITVSGTGFSLTSPNFTSGQVLAPAGTATFTIGLSTANIGRFSGNVSFANSDADENPFNFGVSGTINEVLPAGVFIVDDGDTGFSTIGNWAGVTNYGFGSDALAGNGINGVETARWEFTGLTAGTYQVSTTWLRGGDREASVDYVVRETVGGTALGTETVNQTQNPSGTVYGGRPFQVLNTFTISGSTLVVDLSTAGTTKAVIADAVRIELM